MTIPPIGTVVGLAEMKGRWLYSELSATCRWRSDRLQEFAGGGLERLFDEAAAGTPYDELTEADRASIDGKSSSDVGRLIQWLSVFMAFQLLEWSFDEVSKAWAVPVLNPSGGSGPVPLSVLRQLAVPTDPNHPAASARDRQGQKVAEWPIAIPILVPNQPKIQWMLLDGTSRTLGFLATSRSTDTLPIWTAPAPQVIPF